MSDQFEMRYCDRCKAHKFSKYPCVCQKYTVSWADPEDDPYGEDLDFYAQSFSEAAERCAQYYNEESGDYSMMSGDDTIEINVINPLGEEKRMRVTAEACIEYSIRELESDDECWYREWFDVSNWDSCTEHGYVFPRHSACLHCELEDLREALKPFAHPDLCQIHPSNADGDLSPIFQRNKAVITLKDCRRAREVLEGRDESP